MLGTLLISGVLFLAGLALFTGRKNWRLHWDRLLIISVALQAAGFLLLLTAPQHIQQNRSTLLGALPCFLGHVCFIAAVNAMIVAVAYRLMPNPGHLKTYIERPSAAGTALMLLTFTLSKSTHQMRGRGCLLFSGPADPWLQTYWIIFALTGSYLVIFLICILLKIRHEYPESRRIVNLYLTATAMGLIAGVVILFRILGCGISPLWALTPICAASGLSFIADSWTWRRNKVH